MTRASAYFFSPARDPPPGRPHPRGGDRGDKRDLEIKNLRNALAQSKKARTEQQEAAFQRGKRAAGGGGKGAKGAKGKKGDGKGKAPEWMQGKAFRTAAGKAICFNFNGPQGCREAAPGGECRRGLHVCAEKGCERPHSMRDHR